MDKPSNGILVLNGGSSSVRFAFYDVQNPNAAEASGKLDRIGMHGTVFRHTMQGKASCTEPVSGFADRKQALHYLLDWLEEHGILTNARIIGHRVVHGMGCTRPVLLTAKRLGQFRKQVFYAPDHLPSELDMIEWCFDRCPDVPQVACFDTAFHANLPFVAQRFALPRHYGDSGIRRYGFHGLSYSFLMETLEEKYGPRQASGRVILAHLGSGASLAAVHQRQCVDTSMGMTPAGGLVMGTRSGDLDPGLMLYFLQHEQLKPSELNDLINHGSGLLGVSGTTSDMRDLLQMEPTDSRAKEAIALFCYQARKWTGAFAAALNGLDSLVFSGGIGEHCAVVRSRICEGLGYLGVRLDERRNAADDEIISSPDSDVMVYVLPTDEERMIARQACRLVCDEMDQNKGES